MTDKSNESLKPIQVPNTSVYLYPGQRLKELSLLPVNWDGKGSVQIAESTIKLAKGILSLCRSYFSYPFKYAQITPSPDGELCLTFFGTHEGKELELWIQDETSPIRYLQVHKGSVTQGTCDPTELTDLFNWLVEDLRTCACKFSSRSPTEHCVQCIYPPVQIITPRNEDF